VSKARVETFSDGIFAIAITLLVLTIAQPKSYQYLGRSLANSWPDFAAYVVSFVIIGIMWLNHHAVFVRIETVDRAFTYLNFLLLMTITFLPYPTGVFGQALKQGHGAKTAAVFYTATMAVNAYAWAALWLYASHGRRLLKAEFPEDQRSGATIAYTGGVVLYTAAVGIAFLSPYAALAFQGALALYYAFDPLSRRAERTMALDNAPPAGDED
jgi:TMEM175 potassium channel family protein